MFVLLEFSGRGSGSIIEGETRHCPGLVKTLPGPQRSSNNRKPVHGDFISRGLSDGDGVNRGGAEVDAQVVTARRDLSVLSPLPAD